MAPVNRLDPRPGYLPGLEEVGGVEGVGLQLLGRVLWTSRRLFVWRLDELRVAEMGPWSLGPAISASANAAGYLAQGRRRLLLRALPGPCAALWFILSLVRRIERAPGPRTLPVLAGDCGFCVLPGAGGRAGRL
jgi:hypothetical protein